MPVVLFSSPGERVDVSTFSPEWSSELVEPAPVKDPVRSVRIMEHASQMSLASQPETQFQ